MIIRWRHDDACECGEQGCYATAEVMLPEMTLVEHFYESDFARAQRQRLSGGVRSPQDPRR